MVCNPSGGRVTAGEVHAQTSTVLKLRHSLGQAGRTHQGGVLMLWTVFMLFMAVWMLGMVLEFGARAIQIVLVVSLMALLLRLIFRRTSFS
jgi:hypothetical protein